MDQYITSPVPGRRTSAIHVRKYRRVRASPNKTSPTRRVSIMTSRCNSISLEKADDKLKSLQQSLSINSAYFPDCPQMMAEQSTPSIYSIPMSQQSSHFTSYSDSDTSQRSEQNSQSSADYSMTHMTGLFTPDHKFSDSDSSFHDSQNVLADAPSSLHPGLSSLRPDQPSSRYSASSGHQQSGRPTLLIDTKMDGSANGLSCSPVDGDPKDDFPYAQILEPMTTVQYEGTKKHLKSECQGPCLHSVTGRQQMSTEPLNVDEVSDVFGISVPSSLENEHAQPVQVAWCHCHSLLKRPGTVSIEPGTILHACRSYSQQMRNTRKTLLRRLQDRFESLWQRVCLAVPGLQSHVQQALSHILDEPPTTLDGLRTLSLLSDAQPPPSLHGYISLTFFTKAWLSLEEKQGMADVMCGLFFESARCVAAMASSDAERDACDILLQLLWQPFGTNMSPAEKYPLFCPKPSHFNISTSGGDSRTNTTSMVGVKWVLSYICRDIVDVLLQNTKGGFESPSPTVRGAHADPTLVAVTKICCLIEMIHNSRDGGLVIICLQCCIEEFTGHHRKRNLKKHMTSSCSAIRKGPDYQHVSCPHCRQTFTRHDNVHPHIRRKHPSSP